MEQGWARDTMAFIPESLLQPRVQGATATGPWLCPHRWSWFSLFMGPCAEVSPAHELGQLPMKRNNTKFSDRTICFASKPRKPELMEQRPFPTSPPQPRAEHCPPGLE